MLEYSYYRSLADNKIHCRILRDGVACGDERTFRTIEQAERWAESEIAKLETK